MPVLSRSILAPQGEIIDLTATPSASRASSLGVAPPGPSTQLIDLTTLDAALGSPRDHMHVVVSLLRAGAIETQDTSDEPRKGRVAENIDSPRRKFQVPLSQSSNIKLEQAHHPIDTVSLQRFHPRMEELSLSSIPSAWRHIRRSDVSVVDQQQAQSPGRKPFKPFPFMEFPPEIRNCVYKMLLTTPRIPIEFPEPTGRNRALRAASWAKCTTWKMRRMHKTIFLEILEVSKQLHAEARGILYGCNVFKYRSDYGTWTN